MSLLYLRGKKMTLIKYVSYSIFREGSIKVFTVEEVKKYSYNNIPEIAAEMSGEEAVDERISGRVERRQALDERGDGDHRLRLWDVAVNLKQVKHYVRRPAQDKY